MKKLLKLFGMFSIVTLAGIGVAHAADPIVDICPLIEEMQGVFAVLKILAVAGAVFCIAEWAWGYIKTGSIGKDEIKDKSVGLLVGFGLLFGITMVLQFLPGMLSCVKEGW
jgi:hypothetical protein